MKNKYYIVIAVIIWLIGMFIFCKLISPNPTNVPKTKTDSIIEQRKIKIDSINNLDSIKNEEINKVKKLDDSATYDLWYMLIHTL